MRGDQIAPPALPGLALLKMPMAFCPGGRGARWGSGTWRGLVLPQLRGRVCSWRAGGSRGRRTPRGPSLRCRLRALLGPGAPSAVCPSAGLSVRPPVRLPVCPSVRLHRSLRSACGGEPPGRSGRCDTTGTCWVSSCPQQPPGPAGWGLLSSQSHPIPKPSRARARSAVAGGTNKPHALQH